MSKHNKPAQVPARWQAAVLVCRKCSKKVGNTFGPHGDLPLAKALRRCAGKGKARKLPFGVVEVGCLKLCPKGAIVAIDGRQPDRWLLVRPDESLDAIAGRLALPACPTEG